MKNETSTKNRKIVKKNGKSRYTHAIYYRADGTEYRVNFQQAEPAPVAKAAKPATKKAAKTVAAKPAKKAAASKKR
jgi:septal ring-binding cell division protein DamX